MIPIDEVGCATQDAVVLPKCQKPLLARGFTVLRLSSRLLVSSKRPGKVGGKVNG